MPIEVHDVDGGLGNIIAGHGVLTGEEYLGLLVEHLSQDPESFARYRYSLVDFMAVTEVQSVTPEVIKEAVSLCEPSSRINPDALVCIASPRQLVFGLSRMWQLLMDSTAWEIMVVDDRPAAERWIRDKVGARFQIENLSFA